MFRLGSKSVSFSEIKRFIIDSVDEYLYVLCFQTKAAWLTLYVFNTLYVFKKCGYHSQCAILFNNCCHLHSRFPFGVPSQASSYVLQPPR